MLTACPALADHVQGCRYAARIVSSDLEGLKLACWRWYGIAPALHRPVATNSAGRAFAGGNVLKLTLGRTRPRAPIVQIPPAYCLTGGTQPAGVVVARTDSSELPARRGCLSRTHCDPSRRRTGRFSDHKCESCQRRHPENHLVEGHSGSFSSRAASTFPNWNCPGTPLRWTGLNPNRRPRRPCSRHRCAGILN